MSWRILTKKALSDGAQRVLFRMLSGAGVPTRPAEVWPVPIPDNTVITTLGKEAFNLFEKGNLSDCRGGRYKQKTSTGEFWIVPTYDPLELMKIPDMWSVAIHDIRTAWNLHNGRDLALVKENYQPNPTTGDIKRWIGKTDLTKPITLDVETSMDARSLYIVGFGQGPGDAIAIPFGEDYIPFIYYILKNATGGFLCQNGNFDRRVIEDVFGLKIKQSGDTLLAHHLKCSEMPHDLGFIISLYTNMNYHKNTSKDDLALYNCKDVDGTTRSHEGLLKDLEEDNLLDLYEVVMKANEVVFQSQIRGLKVDLFKLKAFRKKFATEAFLLKQDIIQMTGDKYFNPGSPKQVADYLFKRLKLPECYDRKTGKPTTRDEVLEKKFARKSMVWNEETEQNEEKLVWQSPEIEKILEWRHQSKMLSTYLFDFTQPESIDFHYEPLAGHEDQIMTVHLPVKIHGTASGRYSSFIHTWPSEMREIIIPTPGYIFIAADFSQIEWRLGAFLSQDPVALEILASGQDIHLMAAMLAFSKKAEDITKHERHLAKRISHGSSYGIGAESIAVQFGISKQEAIDIQKRVLSPFRRLIEWREDNLAQVQRTGYLINPFGRRRYFLRSAKDLRGEVFSYLQQSTCHDMIMRASIAMFEEHPEVPFVLDHHDENVWESLLVDEEKNKVIIKEVMEREWLPGFSCPSTVVSGVNWKECK